MPVSVVVGGQFGSEGKGKVALEIVRRDRSCAAAVRVGGTNSGHTAVDKFGKTWLLRQLPAAIIDRGIQAILPPGSYIDVDILKHEIAELGLRADQVAVSPMARIITSEHRDWEAVSHLGSTIGSTQSGTGASVLASIAREADGFPMRGLLAGQIEDLQPYFADTTALMRQFLKNDRRVVIEGTQGFGLSLLHGGSWPKATSRDTTAAAFVSEAGLSPLDVDDVTMVIRCHPIRVAGNSGPLVGETSWKSIASAGGLPSGHQEFTTVTKRVRRIGAFDPHIVRRAIEANNPTRIVLNHLDYVDWGIQGGKISEKARRYFSDIQKTIERSIDWIGIGPDRTIESSSMFQLEEVKSLANRNRER